MISDLQSDAAPGEITGDVCIVGTGPAGITLALELARKGRQVVLLEAGGEAYESATQDLYRGQVIGHKNIDVAASRLRQFGGTSGHWTGLCAPLDPLDFEPRADIPYHGWPIDRAELDPFYARAQDYLDLGPFRYEWDDWKSIVPFPALPLDPAKVFTDVYQQSPPTRFAEKYMETVRREPRIACWLHANLTDVTLAEGSDTVVSITAKTLSGKTAKVTAKTFVIACGGIENARILLNCRAQRPAGLGNENDLVGRFYTDHMTIETSTIIFNDDVDTRLYPDVLSYGGAELAMGLKIARDVILAQHLNNNSAFLVPRYDADVYNDDFRNYGWIAFSTMLKTFSRGHVPDRLGERYCDVVDDLGQVATGVYRHAVRQVFPPKPVKAFRLRQDAEQSPNPDSRVTLIAERDPLGLQRVALDWRIANDDLLRVRRTHEYIGAAIGAAGIGRLQLGISDPPDPSIAFSGYHHMGTTRMHADPKQGVVDANSRLHSVQNLYMAGSSVFTTGGCANPTLTITALAIRLAEHLAAVA
jgi:choline dehydrogenase-like flavoprotein